MSDREIALFFKKSSAGSVCGRFLEDQLNRDMEIPRKRIPWIKYFFQFLLPGFLISMKATAQGKVKVMEEETNVAVKNPKLLKNNKSTKYTGSECTITQGMVAPLIIAPIPPEPSTVHGKVVDENDTPVPFATVVLKGTINGTVADSNGVFSLNTEGSWDSIYLVASSVGFLPVQATVTKADAAASCAIVLRVASKSMGEVVIISPVPTHRKGMIMCVRSISAKYKIPGPVAQEHLKVYPNPIQVSSTVHIEWDKKEYGDHSLHLYTQSGQLVSRRDIYIDQETRVLSIDVPNVPAGSYFLRITNQQTNKSYSEKIIIQ